MCSSDIFLGLIAILFPPLAVWVKTGLCSADSLINILLCMLGFIPGLLHAWYIIAKYPDPDYEYSTIPTDAESQHVTYVIVQGPNGQQRVPKTGAGGNGRGGYGTVPQLRVSQRVDGSWGVGGQEQGVVNSAAPTGGAGGNGGEGGSAGAVAPPSYAQAVKGDHKVQSNE